MGAALADVLTGAAEPGGRMPTTWGGPEDAITPHNVPVDGTVRYDEGLHVGYRAYLRDGVSPAIPFGHGLGSTTWTLTDVTCAGPDAVTLRVANTWQRAGKQVVQVYLSRPESAVQRPVRWLAAFEVARLGASGATTLTIPIPRSAYRHWDVAAGAWAIEPGPYQVYVGTSAEALDPGLVVVVGNVAAAPPAGPAPEGPTGVG